MNIFAKVVNISKTMFLKNKTKPIIFKKKKHEPSPDDTSSTKWGNTRNAYECGMKYKRKARREMQRRSRMYNYLHA